MSETLLGIVTKVKKSLEEGTAGVVRERRNTGEGNQPDYCDWTGLVGNNGALFHVEIFWRELKCATP